MKTVAEMRDATKERVDDLTDGGKKAAYAMVGAPVVAGKRIADVAGKGWETFRKEFETWVAEGERLSGEVRETKVVAELKERMDFDQLQGRVEKLKDQLEDVLTNWRETFKPDDDEETLDEPVAETIIDESPIAEEPAPFVEATIPETDLDES
jgi:hypothetical protein